MTGPRLAVWPPLPPDAYARRAERVLPFPLEEASCRLYERARHALWHGVRALGLGPGDEVLAPAYHHGSEIEALVRAGVTCRFYEATETLAPDEDELEALRGERTRALYLVHYLGFPQDAPRWRAWCDARGLLLLEDGAQAWLADGVGGAGDLAIFCLYKTVGLPETSAVVGPPAADASAARPPSLRPALSRHVSWLLGRSARAARVRPVPDRSDYDWRADFALGNPNRPPSAVARLLLPRLAGGERAREVVAARRAHYLVLLDELGDLVPSPFATLAEGASPFAFPIEVEAQGKAELLARLRTAGVDALDFWTAAHPATPDAPGAGERRATTVCLPVHQELRPRDLERIVAAVRPGPRRALAVERVDASAVADEWDQLAARADSPFATREWHDAWTRRYAHDAACFVVRANGRADAILALDVHSERPLRVVRFAGHGPADRLGPICGPEARARAAQGLRRALAELEADVLLAEQLPGDEPWAPLLGGRTLARDGSPVLRFRGRSWDELLRSWSSNFREQVRRRERRLAREHDVSFRPGGADLDADLDLLFALHRRRWGIGTAFLEDEGFHREFAAAARDRGWLRLWFLEVDGEAVAGWYGFRFGRAESYYQSGRDPAWDHRSVGFVLLAHTIREALADGLDEYRFLRGGEGYKYRFADGDPGLATVGVGVTAAGRAALAVGAAAGPRVGRRVRRRVLA